MKIRAITLGIPISLVEQNPEKLTTYLTKIKDFKKELLKQKIEVQTVRLCTPAFDKNTQLNQNSFFNNPDIVLEELDNIVKKGILDYYSAFPGLCDQAESLTETQKILMNKIPELLKEHEYMFSSIQTSSTSRGINLEAIAESSHVIKSIEESDSFQNLKFAVTFNVPPNTPFFPSAYHSGDVPKISIALEAADEIVNIVDNGFKNGKDLNSVRSGIRNRFTEIYDNLHDNFAPFCEMNGLMFEGVDFSPAQYPVKEKSIGTAVENFNIARFGELGTVFLIGFLTSTLQGIERPHIGFSGFMQPMLEDYIIAKRHIDGKIDITKMLLNSTVCGLGLDCIPLPGDIDEKSLTALMMDTAMISTRLNKPLTARLMPVKNKSTGNMTEFDFEYFTNSKICSVTESSMDGLEDFLKKNPGFLL